MPWHRKSTKGAASCDKPRGGANGLRSGDSRMGNPPGAMPWHPRPEYIGRREATGGTETSKYPEEEKSTEIARVAASESAPAQTRVRVTARRRCDAGVVGPHRPGLRSPGRGDKGERERNGPDRPARQGEGPVREPPPPARCGARVAPDT